jgi:lipid-A-disaccharide synthase
MAAAMPLIRARVRGVQFVVACAPTLSASPFAPLAQAGATLVHDRTDDAIAAADVVVTASGTATVQTALHEKPMVVVYRLSALSYAIGKPFVSVSMYAMPNLVAGRPIVPELIQDGCTPERIADETVALLTDSTRRERASAELADVARQLGQPGASGRAAEAVLRVARSPRPAGTGPT